MHLQNSALYPYSDTAKSELSSLFSNKYWFEFMIAHRTQARVSK